MNLTSVLTIIPRKKSRFTKISLKRREKKSSPIGKLTESLRVVEGNFTLNRDI